MFVLSPKTDEIHKNHSNSQFWQRLVHLTTHTPPDYFTRNIVERGTFSTGVTFDFKSLTK